MVHSWAPDLLGSPCGRTVGRTEPGDRIPVLMETDLAPTIHASNLTRIRRIAANWPPDDHRSAEPGSQNTQMSRTCSMETVEYHYPPLSHGIHHSALVDADFDCRRLLFIELKSGHSLKKPACARNEKTGTSISLRCWRDLTDWHPGHDAYVPAITPPPTWFNSASGKRHTGCFTFFMIAMPILLVLPECGWQTHTSTPDLDLPILIDADKSLARDFINRTRITGSLRYFPDCRSMLPPRCIITTSRKTTPWLDDAMGKAASSGSIGRTLSRSCACVCRRYCAGVWLV